MAAAPPSMRELELETLLRERESQLIELTDEITYLRRYLVNQPPPSLSDPISIPPALLSVLQSYVGQSSKDAQGTSGTMTAALAQRSRILQEENDELYGLLQNSKTGQLKEEVRSLSRTVTQLSQALKDAHSTIKGLSEEVDKSYTSFLANQNSENQRPKNEHSRSRSRSPTRTTRRQTPSVANNGDMKNIPTEPRAHKKPRLNESQASPSQSPVSAPRSIPTGPSASASAPSGWKQSGRRDRSPRGTDDRALSASAPAKERDNRMDEDESASGRYGHGHGHGHGQDNSKTTRERDRRDRPREREKERTREKPREKEKKREEEREREHESSRRNGSGRSSGGGGSGGGLGGGRKGGSGRGREAQDDRTLRQRMGM